MPTASRLMAAICLAFLGYVVSQLVMPLMPERSNFGNFVPVNVALGLVVGWVVMGRRAGRGTTAAINNGLTGVSVLMLWGLGLHASSEMFRLAMRNRYDGALEALSAIFQIALEYGTMIAIPSIGIVLLIGAVVSGLLTEFVKIRWQ